MNTRRNDSDTKTEIMIHSLVYGKTINYKYKLSLLAFWIIVALFFMRQEALTLKNYKNIIVCPPVLNVDLSF